MSAYFRAFIALSGTQEDDHFRLGAEVVKNAKTAMAYL